MEWSFFGWFFGIILFLELIIFLPLLNFLRKIRDKNYDKIETKVVATKTSEQYFTYGYDDSSVVATYEWVYNGKKRKLYVSNGGTSFGNHVVWIWHGIYPATQEITISKRTGKYKKPHGQTNVAVLGFIIMLLSSVVAYYLAIKITGINPIANK